MTLPPMSLVEAASVSAEKPLHSYAEIRLGRRHDEMEVRVEEAVSDAAHLCRVTVCLSRRTKTSRSQSSEMIAALALPFAMT